MKATVAELVAASTGRLIAGTATTTVFGVATDTRSISAQNAPNAQNAFVALVGEHHDGHRFLADAVAAGASCLIVSKIPEQNFIAPGQDAARQASAGQLPAEIAIVLVPDTLTALGDIAHWWRSRFAIPIVGITGSAGKTTTKEMLAAICATKLELTKNAGNFNNLVGLPLSLLAMPTSAAVGIFEMGTNSPGEIKRLAAIAQPTLSIITNIGSAHLGGFGSIARLREEKLALFAGTKPQGVLVVNNDDEALRTDAVKSVKRTITFGVHQPAAGDGAGDIVVDVAAKNIRQGQGGISFELVVKGCSTRCSLPIYGRHNISNALAAAAAATELGFSAQEIAVALAAYRPPPHRLEVIVLPNGALLIDDAYNANPEAIKRALDTLMELAKAGTATAVLGDMLELGEEAPRFHQEIGAYAASLGVKKLFLRGEYTAHYAAGALQGGMAGEAITIFNDFSAAASALYECLRKGDVVLVKGSRAARMEEIVEGIIAEAGKDDAVDDTAKRREA